MEFQIAKFSRMIVQCKNSDDWTEVKANKSLLYPHIQHKMIFRMKPEHIKILNRFLESEKNIHTEISREIILDHIRRDDFFADIVLSYSWMNNLKKTFQLSLSHLLLRKKMNVITRVRRDNGKIEYNLIVDRGLVIDKWIEKDEFDSLMEGTAKIGQRISKIEIPAT